MTTEKFATKEEVMKELLKMVKSLRKHITPEEQARLNPTILDGLSPINCILGQLTGYARSERALELIEKSTTYGLHIQYINYVKSLIFVSKSETNWNVLEQLAFSDKDLILKLYPYLMGKTSRLPATNKLLNLLNY